jgi:hypothetical protein
MRKLIYAALITAVLLSLGCAVTNYPVIFDDRGPWGDTVLDSFYDQAYIVPSASVATIWADGSDELFSTVVQDVNADQWLYTYNNYDASGIVTFLDQTYCDPTHADCAVITAWNPYYPEAYPHGDQSNTIDDPFDYTIDDSCSGLRSLSYLVSMASRLGECGSGVMADPQAFSYEFSLLDQVNFRGQMAYELPIDSSIASFTLTSHDNGVSQNLPLYGRFTGYLDRELRLALPITPNMEYQRRAMGAFSSANGNRIQVDVTYGSLTAVYNVEIANF